MYESNGPSNINLKINLSLVYQIFGPIPQCIIYLILRNSRWKKVAGFNTQPLADVVFLYTGRFHNLSFKLTRSRLSITVRFHSIHRSRVTEGS